MESNRITNDVTPVILRGQSRISGLSVGYTQSPPGDTKSGDIAATSGVCKLQYIMIHLQCTLLSAFFHGTFADKSEQDNDLFPHGISCDRLKVQHKIIIKRIFAAMLEKCPECILMGSCLEIL